MLEVELHRETTAPRAARALLRNRFSAELSSDELETAALLVSELVTNAVRHGRGKITLRMHLDDDRLLVEVIDEGGGLGPVTDRLNFRGSSGGGRGLPIVDAASSRWGFHRGTAHVWFELERDGARTIEARASAAKSCLT